MVFPTPYLVDQPPKVAVLPGAVPVNVGYAAVDVMLAQEVVLVSVEPKDPIL